MKNENKYEDLYNIHQDLGFPEFSIDQQCEMLISRNFKPIIDLAPHLYTGILPRVLLEKYLTITRQDLINYMKNTNFIQEMLKKTSKSGKADGIWLRKINNQFEMFERERGTESQQHLYSSEEEVIEIYANLIPIGYINLI